MAYVGGCKCPLQPIAQYGAASGIIGVPGIAGVPGIVGVAPGFSGGVPGFGGAVHGGGFPVRPVRPGHHQGFHGSNVGGYSRAGAGGKKTGK